MINSSSLVLLALAGCVLSNSRIVDASSSSAAPSSSSSSVPAASELTLAPACCKPLKFFSFGCFVCFFNPLVKVVVAFVDECVFLTLSFSFASSSSSWWSSLLNVKLSLLVSTSAFIFFFVFFLLLLLLSLLSTSSFFKYVHSSSSTSPLRTDPPGEARGDRGGFSGDRFPFVVVLVVVELESDE